MITDIAISSLGLNVTFENKLEDFYPNIWLRDHAKDEINWDSRSSQRKTFTASLDPNLHIKKALLNKDDGNVEIIWSDLSKPTNYDFDFLYSHSLHFTNKSKLLNTWNKNEIDNQIFIDFNEIFQEKGFIKLIKLISNFGFAVISDCEPNIGSVEKIAKKIGYVRHSIFGGLFEFESDENMADSAYTQEELRPHTDGSYSYDAPGLQLLLCCHYNAKGGESIIVDGFKIAEKLKKDDPSLFDILSKVEVPGNYIGDGVFLEAKRHVFKINSNKELLQVTFNNYDRGSFRIDNDLTVKFYEAIKKFDTYANSKDYQWRHILKPGEMLIFDNWRLLHGRGAFNGSRKMAGCYLNKEDFDSTCRMNNI